MWPVIVVIKSKMRCLQLFLQLIDAIAFSAQPNHTIAALQSPQFLHDIFSLTYPNCKSLLNPIQPSAVPVQPSSSATNLRNCMIKNSASLCTIDGFLVTVIHLHSSITAHVPSGFLRCKLIEIAPLPEVGSCVKVTYRTHILMRCRRGK